MTHHLHSDHQVKAWFGEKLEKGQWHAKKPIISKLLRGEKNIRDSEFF
jgi:hypothetical protein